MSDEIKRILKLCDERNWTKYRLAKKMDVPPSNIYSLMRRTSTPGIATLKKACEAFGITMEQFYHSEETTCIAEPYQVEMLKKYLRLTKEKRMKVDGFIDALIKEQELEAAAEGYEENVESENEETAEPGNEETAESENEETDEIRNYEE